jgi:uncharacterized protein (TIGR03435 family)
LHDHLVQEIASMKTLMKLTLWTVVLSALSAGVLFAQDLTGTWQGTVQDAQPRRLVIKVAADGGALRVVLYSIDRGPAPYAGTITLTGTAVRMSIPSIDGTYDAKLSADGTEIAGTYLAQGAPGAPLTLKHVAADAAWAIPAAPAPLKPMAADANPAFEVATIKPSNPDAKGKGILVRGRQFSTLNTSLSDLITFAYGLHARQITNGPAWLEQDKYDLLAQPDGDGQPNDKQWRTMLQKLIADRFKLSFHQDKKELSVYAIVVVEKTGAKITKSAGDPNGLPGLGFGRLGALTARNANMTDFAQLMQGAVLDRPVVDQTGLSGRFDFTLTWTPDQGQFASFGGVPASAATDDPNAPPGLFTAIQEQLGLKLDSTKASADVIVIDRVEKPSAD